MNNFELRQLEAQARQKEKELAEQRAKEAAEKRDKYKVAAMTAVISAVTTVVLTNIGGIIRFVAKFFQK